MPYCNIEEIKNVIPEKELINLTVDVPTAQSVVDESRLNSVISFGDEVIDGYLRSRYALPLSQTPQLIKSISVDIAVYRLYLRRPQKMNETIENSYKNAIKLLEQIQKGLICLDIENAGSNETPIKTGFYRTNKTKADRVFSKEALKGF